MTRYPATEPDRARRKAQRVRDVKAKVLEFLQLNCTLAETAEVIEDLYQHVHNDLRREQRHREARRP
jgi:hypothetical protein